VGGALGGDQRRRAREAEVTAQAGIRSGPDYWLGSYWAMVKFELLNLRVFLSIALLIQILTGAGMAYMYGFYLGEVPHIVRVFIVSGIPALALVPIGLVMVPNAIMSHKIRDTYDFVWSLPVPRLASAAATFTVFTALAVPGTLLSLWIADIRYGVDLAVSWSIVPAILLTSLMATSVGFGMAHAIPEPRITNLITNLIMFLALLFAPIIVPIDQFPDWWAAVNRVLPFYHMAQVIRGGLTIGLVDGLMASYLVLGLWTVAGWSLAAWVVGRRT
jgi:ABC-2 type transport system permease protein